LADNDDGILQSLKEEFTMIDKSESVPPSLLDKLKRSRVEIIMLLVMAVAIIFLPQEARMGLLGLFITKGMFVTMGVLYAHISRKFLFPYLDAEILIAKHHWGGMAFLTVWYGVIIWAFSMGG
jgi:hypothetical protein